MKNYEKPVVLMNEDLAEGIYAASGELVAGATIDQESDCWSLNVTSDQDNAGGYHTYRVAAVHSTDLVHISSQTVVTIVFSKPVTQVEFEGFSASVSGMTATLVRENHANSYRSGDNYNTLLKAWCEEPETLSIVSATIACTHVTNVQGQYD